MGKSRRLLVANSADIFGSGVIQDPSAELQAASAEKLQLPNHAGVADKQSSGWVNIVTEVGAVQCSLIPHQPALRNPADDQTLQGQVRSTNKNRWKRRVEHVKVREDYFAAAKGYV